MLNCEELLPVVKNNEAIIKPEISVIICTHNPRTDYLQRVLDALKAQSLQKEQWELLLIDNASKEPLAAMWDLAWHPCARHVREEELGLTPARLRGIKEAQGELLVFVDDDNVLASDYLAECARIGEQWPILGAWGGQQFPEFEGGEPAEAWKREFWSSTLKRDVWSNNYDLSTAPAGAGVCVRRHIALKYVELVETDPLRKILGRKGAGLNAGEDIDMDYAACDMGLGVGRFCSLKLVHLIPQKRTTDDYIFKIVEGFGFTDVFFKKLRGGNPQPQGCIDRLVQAYKWLRMPRPQRLMDQAREAGVRRAFQVLKNRRF